MKKLLIAVLAVLLAFSFVACSASNNEQGEPAPDASDDTATEATEDADVSWQTIEDKGSFTLGFDEGFAPMGFKDENGEHVGFDLDLATEVASRLGLELKLQPVDWDSKVMELNNGNIDMIWNGLSITADREKEMLFSNPYMNNQQIIIIATGSDIATKADLAGKVVAAQVESSAITAIEEENAAETFAELIESPDYVQALTELKNGSVDAVVVDEIAGRYYVTMDSPDTYVVLEDTFGSEQYGIGFRMDDAAFRDKIQETIDAMIADETAAQISDKWFGNNVIVD